MKKPKLLRAATAALIAVSAISFSPASAQDAAQQTVTPPAPQVSAPASQAATTSQPGTPAPVTAPRQEVVQPLPVVLVPPTTVNEVATPEPVQPRNARASQRRAVARNRAASSAAAAPIVQSRTAATPSVAKTPPELTEAAPAPVEAVEPLPVANEPVASGTPADTSSQTATRSALWIALLALAALVIVGFLFTRNRRNGGRMADDIPIVNDRDEAHAVPLADAVAQPNAETSIDLDARPWIRLSLQPMRGDANGNHQAVDFNLIVENEGHVIARDVQVSSYLTELDKSLIAGAARDAQLTITRVDIAAGESIIIPGSVSVRAGVDPHLVADARYPLPNGGEGHLAARFGIDMSSSAMEAHVEDVLERV